ncbi:HpcH/HpaI aldolase family protein [Halomarina pelagica]|uniref:HpcH/HpaI aldolase family protein n=1 Tax=Halomarina pelagica TaxID=2961599 RepID=UPI0020C5193C|nr:aldolase/citrate lyase family protein [Halomarina sp. BND7]
MNPRFHRALTDGERVVGNWISIGHPAVGEISAQLGFDFVVVDTEHTSTSVSELEDVIRAVDAADGDTAPLVRVPNHDPGRVKRVLDAGAAGLMFPMVETAEAAAAVVAAMQYPPDGVRGAAPARASDYGRSFGAYFRDANDALVTIVQIETARGVENAAEIAAVDGVDAIQIGQGDLSASLGAFGDWDDDDFTAAVAAVVDAAHAADVPVGMLALDHDDIDRWLDAGVDFMQVGADMVYLAEGAEAARSHFEEAVGE